MAKNKETPFMPYEGKKAKDRHIRLTKHMMGHESYINLNYSSQKLYNYMKLWASGRKEIEYSWSQANKIMGGKSTFKKAKTELENKGFIKCIRTSKCSRYPNKYRFISDWYAKV